MSSLSDFDLRTAANANLAEHASWVQRRTPGMRVIDSTDLLLVDCGLPCDTFNLVCRARLTADSASPRIHEAIDTFAEVKRPFSWWLNPGDQPSDLGRYLVAAGLQEAETELAMAADLRSLKTTPLSPDGLRIERVRTATQLHDFAQIVAANWTPPDDAVLHFYDLAAPVLLTDEAPLWFYVGYLDDVPVASAELTVSDGAVGLYSICTLRDYRRRGFGSALTLQPLLDARAQSHTTAILQASEQGAGIYARLGFQPFGHITEYKPPDTH